MQVLNVGGNNKAIALPPQYEGYEHRLLDIDPAVNPDVLCDARRLTTLQAERFEAVYCSHNLEHYHHHEVNGVLGGFLHVLKSRGFAHILVPDLQQVMRITLERGLDLEDVLYQSAAGPITVLDVLYGYGVEIERSGHDYFAHKTGFTQTSLLKALQRAGFAKIYCWTRPLEIQALAFKGSPDPEVLSRFNLS
ncbi:MAG: class I SAM-dependent methyltransferase [Magnetococcales bacterium]|nr:class I SAM-dependent methyltransferase [Magnetococcales bacterium]